MTLTSSIGLFTLIGLVLYAGFLLFRYWRNALLAHRFSEAIQAENNGEAEKAIGLYQEALRLGRGGVSGDPQLLHKMERRLKTLRTNLDFIQRFHTSLK